MSITRSLFRALFLFSVWILSGCLGAVPPSNLRTEPPDHSDNKPEQGLDMALPRALLDKHAEEQDPFTPFPEAKIAQKEEEKVKEKKESPEKTAKAKEEPP